MARRTKTAEIAQLKVMLEQATHTLNYFDSIIEITDLMPALQANVDAIQRVLAAIRNVKAVKDAKGKLDNLVFPVPKEYED